MKRGLLIAVLALAAAGGDSRAAEVRGTVVAAPLAVELELAGTDLRLGERVRATASARNLSVQAIADVALSVRSDPAGIVVLGPAQRAVGTLSAAEVGTRHWVICAARPGNYVVLARAQWSAANGATTSSESVAVLVRVRPDGRSNCPG